MLITDTNAMNKKTICLLKEIPDKEHKHLKITLNKNPMRFDEGGSIVIGEPEYQIVIRAENVVNRFYSAIIYQYADFPSMKEAEDFMMKISTYAIDIGFQGAKVIY